MVRAGPGRSYTEFFDKPQNSPRLFISGWLALQLCRAGTDRFGVKLLCYGFYRAAYSIMRIDFVFCPRPLRLRFVIFKKASVKRTRSYMKWKRSRYSTMFLTNAVLFQGICDHHLARSCASDETGTISTKCTPSPLHYGDPLSLTFDLWTANHDLGTSLTCLAVQYSEPVRFRWLAKFRSAVYCVYVTGRELRSSSQSFRLWSMHLQRITVFFFTGDLPTFMI